MKLYLAVCFTVMMLAASMTSADIIDSESGEAAARPEGEPPYVAQSLPAGFVILSRFSRVCQVKISGCVIANRTSVIGYFDGANYPKVAKYRTGDPDGTLFVFPAGDEDYPINDNWPFLKAGDELDMYPSRCSISATEAGIFGYPSDYMGQYEDYIAVDTPETVKDAFYTGFPTDWMPHNLIDENEDGVIDGEVHDCLASYAGAGVYYGFGLDDGFSQTHFRPVSEPEAPFTWIPDTYPYLNPVTSYRKAPDSTWALAQYIAAAGYFTKVTTPPAGNPYPDVAHYYNRYVKGCMLYMWENAPPEWDLPLPTGLTAEDVAHEIDDGYPVFLTAIGVTEYGGQIEGNWGLRHEIVCFGYKWENGILLMLCYDTWLEDELEEGRRYRVVPFPTVEEAGDIDSCSFKRASFGYQGWKIYAGSTLRINNLERSEIPLDSDDYPTGYYAEPFDITFHLPGADRVHYEHTRDPGPDSPYVALINGVGTLPITSGGVWYLRTYEDPALPYNTPRLASAVVKRAYVIDSLNRSPKKSGDGTEVTMLNGTVTHSMDGDSFYFEVWDRSFGIRVHEPDHWLDVGNEIDIVVGKILTDPDGERYIGATIVNKLGAGVEPKPLGMPNARLGGKDYAPLQDPEEPCTSCSQFGVTGGLDINNIGLLVRTWGEVTCVLDTDHFTIWDGSDVVDSCDTGLDPRHNGVKVSAAGHGLQIGDYAAATGVCSLEKVSGDRFPLILTRTSSDIDLVD